MSPQAHTRTDAGFTAIEVLVTIIVAGIFVIATYVLFIAVNQSFALARNRATASDLSYSYLRKYASEGSTPTWFTCSTASGGSNTNDVTVNPNAPGSVLESGTLTTAATGLPPPVSYEVRVLAIYGCSGVNLKKPLRIESKVTFGPSNTVMEHATIMEFE